MHDDGMQEVRDVFLDECVENVELLESGLLALAEGADDALNAVFRAAHSIKGGAATFGFKAMAALAHCMEALLDSARAGDVVLSSTDIDLLLRGVDVLRGLVEPCRNDPTSEDSASAELQSSLLERAERMRDAGAARDRPSAPGTEGGATPPPLDTAFESRSDERDVWCVTLRPHADFHRRGNDGLLLLDELCRLGPVTSRHELDALPDWNAFDPGSAYVGWQAELAGSIDEGELRELFEWAEGDCDLVIERKDARMPLVDVSSTSDAGAPVAAGPAAEPAAVPPHESVTSETTLTTDSAPSSKASPRRAHEPSIRISTRKIDQIIDLVGELVITQSMLSRLAREDGEIDMAQLTERLNALESNTRDLQESVMRTRMLPMSAAFSRLPRLVHDLCRRLGKSVELRAEGGDTELDKIVLEQVVDPLVHIVRNALDHGIESPEVRTAKGKPETGILRVEARQESGGVIIEVSDDGAGLDPDRILAKARAAGLVSADERLADEQLLQLVFSPALSTAEEVTDVSGRGVGLDVVRQNIVALGGRVSLDSKRDAGTRITINLPLSLAILDGQLVRIGGEVYVIPILSIVETQQREQAAISTIPGIGDICRFRGQVLKVIDVASALGCRSDSPASMIVIVEMHGQRSGLLIEEVLGQQQVVVKSLEKNYAEMPGIAGATIMSDGSVALILDPTTLPGARFNLASSPPQAA